MTKRFIFQFLLGTVLTIGNLLIECSPMLKPYLKVKLCELNINELFESESLSGLESIISENELSEIEKLKMNYCQSRIKTIK